MKLMEKRYVCAGCERTFLPEEAADDQFDLGCAACPDCGSIDLEEIEVDLEEELVAAAQSLGDHARMIVERKPELRDRVEVELAQARALVGSLVG